MSASIEALNVRVKQAQQYNENAQYNLKCIDMLNRDHYSISHGKHNFSYKLYKKLSKSIELFYNFFNVKFGRFNMNCINFNYIFRLVRSCGKHAEYSRKV